MQSQPNRFMRNLGLIITIFLQLVALVTLFNKMDARIERLELWKMYIENNDFTPKDALILEERIKTINSSLTEIKSELKEIRKEMKK